MILTQQIEQQLTADFTPVFLSVENESYLHHSGKGGNSHFSITLVSEAFISQALLARHRAVQKALAPFTQEVHALGLHTYTPEEWVARGEIIPDSPTCGGGGK
jgi:BolA protein